MNHCLLELAQQIWPDPNISHTNHEKFARLVIEACIKAVDNMPLHCAHTTFQLGIVECAKHQAITEIKKLLEEQNELASS